MNLNRLLFGVSPETCPLNEVSLTLIRVFAGLSMAFAHGFGKIPPSEKLIEGVAALGFPAPELFAWAASLSEFGGGLLLALGLMTRLAGFFMAVTMFVAAFIVHAADPFQVKELAFFYLVIGIAFALRGAGRFSIDFYLNKKAQR